MLVPPMAGMSAPIRYPTAPWHAPVARESGPLYVDHATGHRRRHHLHESVLQRAVKEAVRRAAAAKHATCHTLAFFSSVCT
jgi:hypothetical protein